MRLKKDIQVKAFLIRNKIRFQTYEAFITVNDEKVGDSNLKMLIPYEYRGDEPYRKRGPKPAKFNFDQKYKKKEIAVIKHMRNEIAPAEKKVAQRPPLGYLFKQQI